MAPTSNKQIKLDEFSFDEDLGHVQVVEGDIPEPRQGEVLVNVYLRPVNPTDVILIKTGWGGAVPLPSNPGSDGQCLSCIALQHIVCARPCAKQDSLCSQVSARSSRTVPAQVSTRKVSVSQLRLGPNSRARVPGHSMCVCLRRTW